jgi:hypothetical protein
MLSSLEELSEGPNCPCKPEREPRETLCLSHGLASYVGSEVPSSQARGPHRQWRYQEQRPQNLHLHYAVFGCTLKYCKFNPVMQEACSFLTQIWVGRSLLPHLSLHSRCHSPTLAMNWSLEPIAKASWAFS